MVGEMKPKDTVLWAEPEVDIERLEHDIHVDVAVVGGGMAGLSAAQAFAQRGKKVAVLEKTVCGGGASGKSAGFITPNAELSFTQFTQRYGFNAAIDIWQLITQGVESIHSNIKTYHLACDYIDEDGLFAATRQKHFHEMVQEYELLVKAGYQTVLYDAQTIQKVLNSKFYFGGMLYENSFGINGYRYCQEMKKQLKSLGVLIFEDSEVVAIDDHTLRTAFAQVTADNIIVCVDRFLPDLSPVGDQVYHVQSFVLASHPLTEQQKAAIFPEKSVMVSDTHLVYNYFRMTSDNRLILGGSDLLSLFASEKHDYGRITSKLSSYFTTMFPGVDITFEYQWPGLIGLSKDTAPIIGPDAAYPHIYYISCVAGLAIAAAMGRYSAQHFLDGRRDMDQYFSYQRSFPIDGLAQKILGKPLSFALSNAIKTSSF